MSKGGGGSDGGEGARLKNSVGGEGVEGSGTVAPGDHVPGTEVLHRKTKRVKLYGNRVVNGKLSNRDKVLDDIWSNKNNTKVKRAR